MAKKLPKIRKIRYGSETRWIIGNKNRRFSPKFYTKKAAIRMRKYFG